jgi:hypothetical protein
MACSDQAQGTARFTVEFGSSSLRERAALVRAQVRDGDCEGDAVFTTDIVRGAASRAQPGKLAKGVYGLWAAARDDSCNWYAEGCRLFKVPASGAELIVVLEAVRPEHDLGCGNGSGSGGDGGATTGDSSGPAPDPENDAGGAEDAGSGSPAQDAGQLDAGGPDAGGMDASANGDAGGAGASGGDGSADGGADAGDRDGGAPGPDDPDASRDAGSPVFDPRAPKCTSAAAAVVACYDFEGSLADGTAQQNDARGSARFETAISGRGLRVNGSTIRVLDDPSLNVSAFTIELWVRIDNLLNLTREPGAPSVLLDKDQQYAVGFLSSGSLFIQVFRAAGDAEITIDDSPIDTGTFRYLAFVYDGSRSSIYLDGTLIGSQVVGVDLFRGAASNLHIGSGSPATTSPFDGLIDALRISRVGLAASEICHNAGGQLSAGVCR